MLHVTVANSLFLRRVVLEKWKQKLGDGATYGNLITAFESAGYQAYADFVKRLFCERSSSSSDSEAAYHPVSRSPSPQREKPVFPSVTTKFLVQKPSKGKVKSSLHNNAYYIYSMEVY